MSGDRTTAEALRIAERWLIRKGFKFTPEAVAKYASVMLRALDESAAETTNKPGPSA